MPGLRLLHDRRGAGTLQMLVLAVGLALAGMGAAKALSSAAGKRSDCAGQEIQAMGAQPCSNGNAGAPGEAAPPPPPPAPKPQPQPEAFDPQKELLNILADILGITDAKKCFTEGDILACVMTFANFSPFKLFGTAFKVIKNIPKIKRAVEALNAFRKARKAEEDARKAEKAAREAREAAAAAKKCKNGKCDKPGVCFAPGTPVVTADGLVPIEELQPGDIVWSRDDQTGEEGYRPIERTFVTPDQELLAVSLEGPSGAIETLDVTAPHPFRVEGRGWVPASELQPGDEIPSADGGDVEVAAVEETGRTSTVYNFQVEEFHTYFVGESAAWVHNDCKNESIKVEGEPDPERVKELGVNHEQGNRIDLAEGQGGARYEQATGRELERSTTEGADFIDPEVGPISLKGPLVNKRTGEAIPINDNMVEGLANSVIKDVKLNTATKRVVVDTRGMTQAQREALKSKIEQGLDGASNPSGKDIVFLE